MPDYRFLRNVARGKEGEDFVNAHLAELTDTLALNNRLRSEEHVEGVDASALLMTIDESHPTPLPDFVHLPGIDNAHGYKISELKGGGIEVKTVWNYLFRTNDNEEPSGTLGFALWSEANRNNYGWLMKILNPESFNASDGPVTAVQPLILVFVLVEYEDVFACVTFTDVPALCNRLCELAARYGFDLKSGVPLGENAHGWSPESALIHGNMWYIPLSGLADIASVTLVGDKPRLRPDIKAVDNICKTSTQGQRYEYLKLLAAEKHIPTDEAFRGCFSPSPEQQIFADIDHNLKALESLDPDLYPSLCRLSSMRVFEHLTGLMECMLSNSAPVWPEHPRRYFAMANSYLKKWFNDHRIQCSVNSIQGSVTFLKDCGLLKAFRTINADQDPTIRAIMNSLKVRKGHKNITLRSVPRYDNDILRDAEKVASIYLDAKVSLTKLRKSDVIRVRGQAKADELYLDGRTISATEEYVHNLFVTVIKELVETKGYATYKDVYDKVETRMWDECAFREIEFDSTDRSDEDTAEINRRNAYYGCIRKLESSKKWMAEEAGCSFRPIRKADRVELNISEDETSWVFVRST